jgi:hypothetical protein
MTRARQLSRVALLVALALVVPALVEAAEWAPNTAYSVGVIVTYQGPSYKCLQAHTSIVTWEPPNTPALWQLQSGTGPTPVPTATPRPGARPRVTPTPSPTPRPGTRPRPTPTAVPTATPGPGSGINPGPGVPSGAAVPYVDVLAWPTVDVNTVRAATGHRYYTFAFIQSRGCEAAVGGIYPMSERWYAGQINSLRAAGGDMVFSFGGAAGIELAQACTTVSSLVSAYNAAKNTYRITTADFDIEGAALHDTAVNDRRHKALKQVGFSKLVVTLPVMPEGLTAAGLDLLRNAKANAVQYSVVNLMTMDYGGAYCGDMGNYAVQAINSVKSQLSSIGYSATVAATPMIGVNDVTCEVFSLSDAGQVRSASPGYRAFWSINRDNGSCAGCGCARSNCSGISQGSWAFTNALK